MYIYMHTNEYLFKEKTAHIIFDIYSLILSKMTWATQEKREEGSSLMKGMRT